MKHKIFAIITVAGLLFSSGGTALAATKKSVKSKIPPLTVKKFTGSADFKNYLKKSRAVSSSPLSQLRQPNTAPMPQALESGPAALSNKSADSASGVQAVDRFSETNVQVAGIDEPDILKTDGQSLFYTQPQRYYFYEEGMPMPAPKTLPMGGTGAGTGASSGAVSAIPIRPPQGNEDLTSVIAALPASEAKVAARIAEGGQLLFSGSLLMIFDNSGIVAYDISDRANPKKAWTSRYENGQSYVSARLKDGKLYVVTVGSLDDTVPCPMRPLSINSKMVVIPCAQVYHPVRVVPDPTSLNAFLINPASGKVEKSVSFVGSANSPIVYMSDSSLYITYDQPDQTLKLAVDFLKQRAQDLVPLSVISKIEKINGYDISYYSKVNEMSGVLSKYFAAKSADDQKTAQTELQNRLWGFAKDHKREFSGTGITKINLQTFAVTATAEVAGRPLNQFSLDEYEGNLRVATTMSGSLSLGSAWAQAENVSDVYVLDGNLQTIGQVRDLGVTERVYSARFIGTKGYVVTFRQTDPFYVLDLSNPSFPRLAGELKIPGFSSYLHPLAENRILGVGMDSGKVKLSLFDVSVAANPSEISKYVLDEYWSEVSSNHHAFLQDSRQKTFFMPAGSAGYVFSYEGDNLSLIKSVSDTYAKRAAFINNYLYVLSDSKLIVVDENTWQRVKEVELQ